MSLDVSDVLQWWFGPTASGQYGRARDFWFRKDPQLDAEISARFGPLIEAASRGALDDWAADPRGALALILVCDQFPRNAFRDDARAFALDPKALALARQVTGSGWDLAMLPVERWFVYMPFEHSESLADQREAVARFEALRDDPQAGGAYEWAVRHLRVIERFGRFPHRNALLGRESTPEEIAFLAQPGSRF